MKLQAAIATIILLGCACAYANDPDSVKEGASDYDWNLCFDNKMDACKLACSSSDDIGCQSDCEDDAADKCRAEGKNEPQY